ncbi:MAG: Dabb family protein [Candidatus Hydrogenedentes bacterium]|nr:Dabb family protein [Candidatus Hydrogenedentota bacterium]
MSNRGIIIAIIAAAAVACGFVAGRGVTPAKAAEAGQESKVLRHVVIFKFKDDAPNEAIQKVEVAFAELPKKVGVIQDFEWGTNVSPEKLDQGYTHCFFLTFKTAEDRDAYLVHPDHKAFGQALGGTLEKALVIDYWASK